MYRLLLVLLLPPFSMAAQSTLNDLDGDGCVGATDILVILGQYGECQDTTTAFACGDSVLFDNYWYETVLIGDQCWFAENLRTTLYADGSAIPELTDHAEWAATSTGARCDYNNVPFPNVATYGRLYNWHAATDASGLCPSGWHVPTDGEWTGLEDYITSQGFDGTEGTALKSTSGWSSGNGTDDFGFAALPGGRRNNGNFNSFTGIGSIGRWWSSSPDGSDAWSRNMNQNPGISRGSTDPGKGFSIRCLRNADHTESQGCTDPAYLCLLYTSPSPRDLSTSRMPSSA